MLLTVNSLALTATQPVQVFGAAGQDAPCETAYRVR
jgi:hypothetical protein